MLGLFNAVCLGKTKEKSKSGKFHYLFVVGCKDKTTGLFTLFTAVDFWTEEDKPVKFGEEYKLSLDVNGEMVVFKGFVE